MFLRVPGERGTGLVAGQQLHILYGTLKALYDSLSRRPTSSRVNTYLPCSGGHIIAMRRFLRYDLVNRGHAKSAQRVGPILICIELVCMPCEVLSEMRYSFEV